ITENWQIVQRETNSRALAFKGATRFVNSRAGRPQACYARDDPILSDFKSLRKDSTQMPARPAKGGSMKRKNIAHVPASAEPAAGNGILNRRLFLEGALVASVAGTGASSAWGEPLQVAPWMKVPGPHFTPYGQPSRFESKVVRAFAPPGNPATPGIGTARTPLHLLEGMMTPSGLHFERSHSGIPDIDPDQHRMGIPGLGKQPLGSPLEAL